MKQLWVGICISVAVLVIAAIALIYIPHWEMEQHRNKVYPEADGPANYPPEWYAPARKHQREMQAEQDKKK